MKAFEQQPIESTENKTEEWKKSFKLMESSNPEILTLVKYLVPN